MFKNNFSFFFCGGWWIFFYFHLLYCTTHWSSYIFLSHVRIYGKHLFESNFLLFLTLFIWTIFIFFLLDIIDVCAAYTFWCVVCVLRIFVDKQWTNNFANLFCLDHLHLEHSSNKCYFFFLCCLLVWQTFFFFFLSLRCCFRRRAIPKWKTNKYLFKLKHGSLNM